MDRIYLFLIHNRVWIYILSAFGLVWYIGELIRAQRALGRAMFNLERETATRLRNHALSFVLFFVTVVGVVYYVNRFVAPDLPEEVLSPLTPTPDIFATPLASPTPLTTPLADGAIAAPPVLAPTATVFGAVVAPITDTLPADDIAAAPTPFAGCIPLLTITEPLNGAVVFQRARFRGTANTGDLHRYVVELNGPGTDGTWLPLTDEPVSQPVVEGELGEIDMSQWASGPYLARLRALDTVGQELGVCTIQVTLDN
ncbi:MAG: hypothetical protein KBG73_05910 [Candidatus Promineofilum sp.]|nr:hypothetical protein [Promineifilum sp.]